MLRKAEMFAAVAQPGGGTGAELPPNHLLSIMAASLTVELLSPIYTN